MEVFEASSFSGAVPLFPLPNVVLFPRMVLPLHIFEPRYRAMTATALEGERLVAMALLRPGWEKDYYGNPPVYEVAGMGKIIQETRLPDGRYNITLYGLVRVRVLQVLSDQPYRTARVRILEETEPLPEVDDKKRSELAALIQKLGGELNLGAGQFGAGLPLGCVCDHLASALEFAPALKQELLEEPNALARCDRLMDLLRQWGRPKRPLPGPSMN